MTVIQQNKMKPQPNHAACSSIGFASATARVTPFSHFARTAASFEKEQKLELYVQVKGLAITNEQFRFQPRHRPIEMFLHQGWVIVLPQWIELFPEILWYDNDWNHH